MTSKAPIFGAFRFRATKTDRCTAREYFNSLFSVAQYVCDQRSDTGLVHLLGFSLALSHGDHSLVPSIRRLLPFVAKDATHLTVAAQRRLSFVSHAAPNPLF